MRDTKETPGGAKVGDIKKDAAGVGAAGRTGTSTEAKIEFCHGSVCLGNQIPTNCICPTVKK